jgi:hypothetical protein
MTTRALCRAIYDHRLDRSVAGDHPGGPEDGNPSNSSECLSWLDHARRLTLHFRPEGL